MAHTRLRPSASPAGRNSSAIRTWHQGREPRALSAVASITNHMRETTTNEHLEAEPTLPRSPQAVGGGWRTGQDRTRLLVTHLWDGRCGHCGVSLVAVEEIGVTAFPLDVDHAHPRMLGGRDELTNYIASCYVCNRSRQADPLRNQTTAAMLDRARHTLREDFDDYQDHVLETDPAFSDPFWTALRCADHDWHIYGSPAQHDCQAQAGDLLRGVPSEEEWWSRFGTRSSEVLQATSATAQRHGMASRDSWEVLWHLPRYALDADHALKLVQTMSTPAQYRSLSPAPMHLLGATLPLAATNSSASARRRDFKATLKLHQQLKNHGIHWLGIARLWTQRHWPSSHLFYHRRAVLALAASGKRQSIAQVATLDTSRAVDEYLEQIGLNLTK